MNLKKTLLLFVLFLSLSSCGQTKSERQKLGRKYAESELKNAISKKGQHNVIDNKAIIIKDHITAIKVVEPILFNLYGEKNIAEQKPYESYLIENYWVICGTLPKGYLGGTFLIIVDARNSEIIKITHGK